MTTGRQGSDEGRDRAQNGGLDEQASPSDASQVEASDQDLISRRAYERFQMRGGEHGRDQEDWLEAERELNKARRE